MRATLAGRSLPLESLLRSVVGEEVFSLQSLLRSIVGLDGLRLNDHAGVAFLPCLTSGGDGSRHIARTQSERCSQSRQGGDKHGDDDFHNLLLTHRLPPFVSLATHRTPDRTPSRGTRSWCVCR